MKHISTLIISISILTLSGCSNKPDYAKLNKENSLKYISSAFEKNKMLNTYKAMAVTIDSNGRSAVGYSHDAKSQESANERALNHCNLAREKANLNSICTIYSEGDNIIQDLTNTQDLQKSTENNIVSNDGC